MGLETRGQGGSGGCGGRGLTSGAAGRPSQIASTGLEGSATRRFPAAARRRLSFSAASIVCTAGSMPTLAPAGRYAASHSCTCGGQLVGWGRGWVGAGAMAAVLCRGERICVSGADAPWQSQCTQPASHPALPARRQWQRCSRGGRRQLAQLTSGQAGVPWRMSVQSGPSCCSACRK
jgi:hypothetical protein